MKTLSTWFRGFRSPQKKAKRLVPFRRRLFRPSIEILEDRSLLSTTYTVTSLLDTNTGSGDSGTLRYVLNQANANHTGTATSPDSIQFAVSGTIYVNAANGGALPGLASDEVAVIDGTSAPGFNGTPLVTLDGTNAGVEANGLTISGGSSIVAGLAIANFSGNGIQLDTNGNDTVQSCYIGITTANTAAGNGANGIFIDGTPSNTIGGEQIIAGNVISANGGDGILIEGATASNNTVLGNFIGTDPTGSIAVGNGGNGIQLENAPNNQIGPSKPQTPVTYYNTDNFPTKPPVSGWEGIRGGDSTGQYLITGTTASNGVASGLLYEGTIDGTGTSYVVNNPDWTSSSVYGPNNLGSGVIQLVGTYKSPSSSAAVNGFIFQGTTSDLNNDSDYATIDMPGAEYNYVHSTAGGLAVGNYDSETNGSLGAGRAFLFNVSNPAAPTYITDIVFPGSFSNTAYGIWYNGGTSYTICGGAADVSTNNMLNQNQPIGQAFLVDYDSSTSTFSNWTSFSYPYGVGYLTHFEGISSTSPGVYTLSADAISTNPSQPSQGALVTVTRNANGSFGAAQWTPLNYPGLDPANNLTTGNSVYGNQVVGIVIGSNGLSYEATVNSSAQLSNVISGNGGSGILIEGAAATANTVVDNNIGTNAPGTAALGNGGNGIEITNGARLNTIGGNAPTGTFTGTQTQAPGKPADGNVISANGDDGVLITGGAEYNTLSGNFIGTDVTGMHAFGNRGDGVGIIHADNNSLIGTTFSQDPFVYLNLICANGGNGLVIDDSNNTTVQANDFGLGDDNATALGNRLDGVLIEGTSQNTQFGGVIPLGNISAGNGRNGVEIADTASGTVVFNTFCGLPAFVDTAVGNKLDGMLITSTGGNNLIRTNVIAGNGLNGIHISGDASGVQVAEDIIGMDTPGTAPLPNGANGVLIDGTAHDNLIGGEQVSVIPQNTISANDGNGIAIEGHAHNNQIFHSFIGLNSTGTAAYGNEGAGIYITDKAKNTTIGGTTAFEQNVISGNQSGIFLYGGGPLGTQIIGNLIGTDKTGQNAMPNNGPGVLIISSSNNQIGGTGAGMGNVIAFNNPGGVVVVSGVHNAILGNSLYSNVGKGIVLAEGTNANNNQPAPVLTSAVELSSSVVQITGTLTAAANTTYSIEFFATPSGTPAGQGQNYLGSLTATTNAQGVASIGFTSTLSSLSGTSFTATATDPVNNSSQFSNAVFASPPAPPSPPSPPPAPTSPPSPSTPTPVGRLVSFGVGFGPGFQLERFEIDSQGQVFAQPFGALLTGNSLTFVASDLIFTAMHNANGSLLGLLQEQGGQLDLMEVLNLVNPFVFNALLTALMKPV